ncbi:hypothetical protein [Photobacterium leiognathi]|nr:hypothetical protein [Photobacterium leiognathi]
MDEQKDLAHEYMIEINAAYASQDIERLEAVLHRIEMGGGFTSASLTISDKALLKEKLDKLKKSIQGIQIELEQYEASDEYQLIFSIGDDWQTYFEEMRIKLEALLHTLENELAALQEESAMPYDYHLDNEYSYTSSEPYLSNVHHVNRFWRQGHWRGDVWVRGHWVSSHTRCR